MRTVVRALAAEAIKFRSLSSTAVTLACAVALGIGLGITGTASVADDWATMSDADRAAFDAVGASFGGLQLAQLAFGVLGVLIVSTEYATGAIRTTMTAVPRRITGFAAKALLLTAVTLPLGELLAFAAYALGQHALGPAHAVHIGEPGVLRAVASAGMYLWVVAMVGFGLGALVRHTPGAFAAMFAVIFLAWPAARAVEGWSYLPDRLVLANASDVLAQVHSHPVQALREPSLGVAYAVLAGYLAIALLLGLWRMTRDT